MSALPQSAVSNAPITLQEYLTREETADYKSEFYQGELFAMTGGSPEHNDIGVNIVSLLRNRLRGSGCRPSASDQRIRIPANGLSTYPDVSIVCGDRGYDELDPHAINNPVVIFEVLSPSTESYDRGKKFELYRQLQSLREYVLVSAEKPLIERFTRRDDGTWLLSLLTGLDTKLTLDSVDASLPAREIYEDIEFGQADEKSGERQPDAPLE
jgi:Uma2 family endonuclease